MVFPVEFDRLPEVGDGLLEFPLLTKGTAESVVGHGAVRVNCDGLVAFGDGVIQLSLATEDGAQGVLVNITGGPSMSLTEVMDEAATIIYNAAGEEANVILGTVIDEKMGDDMMVTVIATGFEREGVPASTRPSNVETPVDLSAYTAFRQDSVAERMAAAGGSTSPRITLNRRPAVDLPMIPRMADPLPDAPGAEFEPVSPLDVPAFLRRQTD